MKIKRIPASDGLLNTGDKLMKRILFVFLTITALNSCSKSPEDKIIGTWVNFDQYEGIREITFSKENLKIKQYQYGGHTDIEIVREYKIVNDLVFIKNYNRDEYYYDRPYYYYSITGNRLFLSGYLGVEIFTKKIEKNMTKIRNSLMGSWFHILNNKKIELLFSGNNMTVIQYDETGNSISENITTYELDEHYLKIEGLENFIEGFYFYNSSCLYDIGKDTLCLLTCVTGSRGDTIETEPLYFERQ
ncbi:MAG: hypothetical protein LBK83_02380 [Treponema sp.]|jgi:hypothetical protein|nr:hypothetical protein [Treponema sp.]